MGNADRAETCGSFCTEGGQWAKTRPLMAHAALIAWLSALSAGDTNSIAHTFLRRAGSTTSRSRRSSSDAKRRARQLLDTACRMTSLRPRNAREAKRMAAPSVLIAARTTCSSSRKPPAYLSASPELQTAWCTTSRLARNSSLRIVRRRSVSGERERMQTHTPHARRKTERPRRTPCSINHATRALRQTVLAHAMERA
jgi:hypothetical protein